MLISLSDVLSDQHKTVEETVPVELEELQLKTGLFPVVSKKPVHVVVTHVKDKELQIKAETKVSVMIPCDH